MIFFTIIFLVAWCFLGMFMIRNELVSKEKKRIIELEEEIKFLERLKLEFDVCICDCGEEWKDSDAADMVNIRLKFAIQKLKDK